MNKREEKKRISRSLEVFMIAIYHTWKSLLNYRGSSDKKNNRNRVQYHFIEISRIDISSKYFLNLFFINHILQIIWFLFTLVVYPHCYLIIETFFVLGTSFWVPLHINLISITLSGQTFLCSTIWLLTFSAPWVSLLLDQSIPNFLEFPKLERS